MDWLKDMPIFKFRQDIEEATKDLKFNEEIVSDQIDFMNLEEEVQKCINKEDKAPDPNGMYPCKCLGPTQEELDEVFKSYWAKIDSNIEITEETDIEVVPEPTKAVEVSKSNSDENKIEVESIKPQNPFKTARQELINNAKKNGQDLPPELLQEPPSTGVKRLGMRVVTVKNKQVESSALKQSQLNLNDDDEHLKGIDPKMLERIKVDVLAKPCNTSWDDIKGLNYAKETMMEAIVYPLLRPDLFSGLRRPPKGVLMFGPPGTGKTLIAKCVSNNAKATFFNVSASTLTSKWIGEGEMLVRTLFTYARVKQPSVIFIDEVDCLLSQRSENEHESSRRLKTEFLVFLDGCGTGESDRMLLIGATNRPQELDEAARRRFTKRLYIPLPDKEARSDMISYHLKKSRNNITEAEIQELSELTNGYSGADIKVVAEEAGMMPFRDVLKKEGLSMLEEKDIPPMEKEHFIRALKKTRPSVSSDDLKHYLEWDKKFGSGSDD